MSRHDPDIAGFKQQLVEMTKMRESTPPSVEAERAAFDGQHGAVPPAEGCAITPIIAGSVCGERITPKGADTSKALIYFHGGGHMFGSPLSHRHLVSRLAAAAGVVAYNMEYRLAPEHPYPAGLDDAEQAYRFVLGEEFKPENLVVGGESAGGNLTAALLLKLRDLGLAQPAGAYLLSPWLDLTQSGASYEARGPHDPMITHAALTACSAAYRAGASAQDPLITGQGRPRRPAAAVHSGRGRRSSTQRLRRVHPPCRPGRHRRAPACLGRHGPRLAVVPLRPAGLRSRRHR